VLGFSFWFLMAVPFASHRETYSWLTAVQTQSLARQFSFGLSSTYRPLSQFVTAVGFTILDPHVFPTNTFRQSVLQTFIWGIFVCAWWLIYSAAPQKRLFALVTFVLGGVFFSGYVHLFHIYGLFYAPVILTMGALLYFNATNTFEKRQIRIAFLATVLVFWHPFATALFVGFYTGFYLATFRRSSRAQHVRALTILFIGMAAIIGLVAIFPRAPMPLDTRLYGFLVSYQTNEVNRIASLVAFLLTILVIVSMYLSPKWTLAACLLTSVLSVVFLANGLPLLLLWIGATLIKLFRIHSWSLLFLSLTASLLPFGGGIGTPIYALFAIIMAAYATALGWSRAEGFLSFLKAQYVAGIVGVFVILLLLVRAGVEVPIITKVATPLLAERERTYQLEKMLAWLHSSDFCSYDIAFSEHAGSPIDSVESAITRRNRPPAAIGDVDLFWKSVLQCQNQQADGGRRTAILTFGGPSLEGASPVFSVTSRHAGDATVWIRNVLE
jgi:hypothetical protein